MNRTRQMPCGVCIGCGERSMLPPFGEGMCFICATDGPPNDRSSTGGAVHEDCLAPDPTSDWDPEPDELQQFVLEAFSEQQTRYASAVRWDAHRAQRFEAGTRVRSRRVDGLTLYEQREIEERRQRREDRSALRQLRAAHRRERHEKAAATIRASRERHEQNVTNYMRRVEATRARRNGAGNFADPALLAKARELRAKGVSLRQIAKITGLHKETIRLQTMTWVSRPAGATAMHERLKAEGRPLLPPWQLARKRDSEAA